MFFSYNKLTSVNCSVLLFLYTRFYPARVSIILSSKSFLVPRTFWRFVFVLSISIGNRTLFLVPLLTMNNKIIKYNKLGLSLPVYPPTKTQTTKKQWQKRAMAYQKLGKLADNLIRQNTNNQNTNGKNNRSHTISHSTARSKENKICWIRTKAMDKSSKSGPSAKQNSVNNKQEL